MNCTDERCYVYLSEEDIYYCSCGFVNYHISELTPEEIEELENNNSNDENILYWRKERCINVSPNEYYAYL